jgi:hypothetical protein
MPGWTGGPTTSSWQWSSNHGTGQSGAPTRRATWVDAPGVRGSRHAVRLRRHVHRERGRLSVVPGARFGLHCGGPLEWEAVVAAPVDSGYQPSWWTAERSELSERRKRESGSLARHARRVREQAATVERFDYLEVYERTAGFVGSAASRVTGSSPGPTPSRRASTTWCRSLLAASTPGRIRNWRTGSAT